MDLQCTWMRESSIDWIFHGPACVVLVVNLMFLLRIMWVSGRRMGCQLVSRTLVHSLSSRAPPAGPHNEAPVGQHSGDQTVPEGVQGPAGADPSAGPHLPGRDGWTQRGSRQPHFRYRSSVSAEHPGEFDPRPQ